MSLFNIFDLGDNRYTAQVVPECYPHERQPALKNWSEEELEAFCGIYTPARWKTLQLKGVINDPVKVRLMIQSLQPRTWQG